MINPMNLSGKQYLVTGASGGVGRQVCITLSQLGARVILTARNEKKLLETTKMLEGDEHKYYIFDLNKVEGLEGFVEEIVTENGKLDGFVHCAGMPGIRPLSATTYDFMQEMMRVQVFSFVEIVRLITKKRNCNLSASIVAISSISSIRGDKAKAAYCSVKGALDSLVLPLAIELGETKKIRVNTVNPAWIKTDIYYEAMEKLGEEKMRDIGQRQFLGIAEPEEISNVVAFLLSNAASQITGRSIVVDGGFVLK